MDKTLSEQQDRDLEALLKTRMVRLKDLFQGRAWQLYQEELGRLRQELLERAVATNHTETRGRLLNTVQAFDLLLDGDFEHSALQAAGQTVDNPEPAQHYMALDSADQRLAKAKEH